MTPKLSRKKKWSLGDPIPEGTPSCQIRVGLEAKVWVMGQYNGFSVGPSTELEVTVPFSELPEASEEISQEMLSIVSRRIDEAVAAVRGAAEKM